MPPIRLLALALVPAALLLAAPAVPAETASAALVEQAEQQLLAEHYRKALSLLERADRQAGGDCGECRLGMARAYNGLGKHGRAVEVLRELVRRELPGALLAPAYNQLGINLLADRRPETLAEAEAAFRRVLELAPREWNIARYNLGVVQLWQGRPEAAAGHARDYLREEPKGFGARDARVLLCLAKQELALEPAPAPPVLDSDAHVERPRILYRQQPVVPESLRRTGLRGSVIVEAKIDQEGCVVSAGVAQSGGEDVDRIALEALRRWVFQPATVAGTPVPVMYSVTMTVDTRNYAAAEVLADPGLRRFYRESGLNPLYTN